MLELKVCFPFSGGVGKGYLSEQIVFTTYRI